MMFRLPWGKYCDICGARMVHFRYPSRYRCPRENQHGAIQAVILRDRQQARGRRRPDVNRNRTRGPDGRWQ